VAALHSAAALESWKVNSELQEQRRAHKIILFARQSKFGQGVPNGQYVLHTQTLDLHLQTSKHLDSQMLL
jgi:hypothetical protein